MTLKELVEQQIETTRSSGDPHVTLTFRSWNGDIAIGVDDFDDHGDSVSTSFYPDDAGIEAALGALRGALEVVKDEALEERRLASFEREDAS